MNPFLFLQRSKILTTRLVAGAILLASAFGQTRALTPPIQELDIRGSGITEPIFGTRPPSVAPPGTEEEGGEPSEPKPITVGTPEQQKRMAELAKLKLDRRPAAILEA